MTAVVATGVSSVVTQLYTIREFLSQFQGNEIVIALFLFNWLIIGAMGTYTAHGVARHIAPARLTGLVAVLLALAVLPTIQLLTIRLLRTSLFIPGVSVGFYHVLLFSFLTMAPYALLVGFALPYSLFILRLARPDYPGNRIYITDNFGDVCGGALFSFVLVSYCAPFTALAIANGLLVLCALAVCHIAGISRKVYVPVSVVIIFILGAGTLVESWTPGAGRGKLVHTTESPYGRLQVYRQHDQYALFSDGMPQFSSHDPISAEESSHYPLSQLRRIDQVLLISGVGGILTQVRKHQPKGIDYVELDPEAAITQIAYGFLTPVNTLEVIYADARAYLNRTDKRYDAVIMNLPEPVTFRINRFYTSGFFRLVKSRLSSNGVFSFSFSGFDNYLGEHHRQKISSIYNSLAPHFQHVLLLPGEKIYFLCSNAPVSSQIPDLLAKKNVGTEYIDAYFSGNLTPERISSLNQSIDPGTPENLDLSPYLMTLMFSQWFDKYDMSPTVFIAVLCLLCLVYLSRLRPETFVLFATGWVTMGNEILVIFAFQLFFGYIYLQIGLIITVFLAGLLPGALYGGRIKHRHPFWLKITDGAICFLMVFFMVFILPAADRLPVSVYLAYGFCVSIVCGFQFPLALSIGGGGNSAVAHSFSADLMGAAIGTLITSVIMIPLFGIQPTAMVLVGFKLISLGTIHIFAGD